MDVVVNSGIYIIFNTLTKKYYVGSSKNLFNRWGSHKRELRLGVHGNERLQHAWLKYGEKSFLFYVLEEVSDLSKLVDRDTKRCGCQSCKIIVYFEHKKRALAKYISNSYSIEAI